MKINKIFLLIFFLCISNKAFAFSPVTTHAGLSQEVVSFYNLHYGKTISDKQAELIIRGSIEEDANPYRAIFHFYDPVYNIGIQNSRTAKEWATDGTLEENIYSWPKAIQYYAEGNEEMAFLSLGHTLHLLGDMVVPDHTRNDEHLRGSVFESWASENMDRETLKDVGGDLYKKKNKPVVFDSINQYFDYLAKYSNENYFSQDTIESKLYSMPKVEQTDEYFAYALDTIFKDTHVVYQIKTDKIDTTKKFKIIYDGSNSTVVSDYFNRLSKRTILAQTGAIKLFLDEAKVAREKYLAEQARKKAEEEREEQELARKIEQANTLEKIGIGFMIKVGSIYKKVYAVADSAVDTTVSYVKGGAQGATNIFSMLVYTAGQGAQVVSDEVRKKVSDIMETGGTAEDETDNTDDTSTVLLSLDENNVEEDRDLTDDDIAFLLKILNQDEKLNKIADEYKLKFVFLPSGGGGSNEDRGRDDEDDKPEEDAPEPDIEAPILSVTSPTCNFSYVEGDCVVATTTIALIFESSTTSVFEIYSDNISTTTATSSNLVLSDGTHSISVVAVGPYQNRSATSTVNIEINQNPIVINEIAWDGSARSSSDEWIELYNRTPYDISLSGWRLSAEDGSPEIALSGIVKANDYFLIERKLSKAKDEATESPIADITADLWISFNNGLENVGEDLALSFASSTENGEYSFISDKIPFCDDWCGNGGGKNTMERFDADASADLLISPGSNWGSNTGLAINGFDQEGNKIRGTPKARNSRSYMPFNDTYVEGNLVLKKSKSPLVINTNFYIGASSSILSIEPGTVIKFCDDGKISSEGRIMAEGQPDDKIVFTSIFNDEYAGDTDSVVNCADELSLAGGIDLFDTASTSVFENIIFSSIKRPLSGYTSPFSVKNSAFYDSYGVSIFNADLEMSDVEFLNLSGPLLDVFGDGKDITKIELENIKAENISASRAGILCDANIVAKNVSVENVPAGDGLLFDNSTLYADKLTIKNIGASKALSLFGGDIKVFNSTFSANSEYGLLLGGNDMKIANSTISGFNYGVLQYDGVLEIVDSNIFDNFVGVDFEAFAGLTVKTSNIYNNILYGVLNNFGSDDNIISARNNYWGDESGPYHEIQNPDGFGNAVSDFVDFTPFSSADYLPTI